MNTMGSISEQIYHVISEALGVPRKELRADTRIRTLPNADSMNLLNIILGVEKRWGIEIPDEATFRLETIGEFAQLVQELYAQNRTDGQPV